ncbi:MAG: hypothetical protein WCS01_03310 [bacterium]
MKTFIHQPPQNDAGMPAYRSRLGTMAMTPRVHEATRLRSMAGAIASPACQARRSRGAVTAIPTVIPRAKWSAA